MLSKSLIEIVVSIHHEKLENNSVKKLNESWICRLMKKTATSWATEEQSAT